jgi:hypothetical protein
MWDILFLINIIWKSFNFWEFIKNTGRFPLKMTELSSRKEQESCTNLLAYLVQRSQCSKRCLCECQNPGGWDECITLPLWLSKPRLNKKNKTNYHSWRHSNTKLAFFCDSYKPSWLDALSSETRVAAATRPSQTRRLGMHIHNS